MKTVRWLSLAVLALALGAWPAQAAVYSGYVCTTNYSPAPVSSGFGNDGRLVVTINMGAHCSGSPVHTVVFCSAGATRPDCSPGYVYTESRMLALHQATLQAL